MYTKPEPFDMKHIRSEIDKVLPSKFKDKEPGKFYNPLLVIDRWEKNKVHENSYVFMSNVEELEALAELEVEKNKDPENENLRIRYECARRINFGALRRHKIPVKTVQEADLIVEIEQGFRYRLTDGDSDVKFILDSKKMPKHYTLSVTLPFKDEPI